MMKHEQNSRFVLCETSRGTLGVEVVAQDILRVFLGRETQNYFSKAVEADRHEDCAFTVTEEGDTLVIATPALRLVVDAAGRTDFYTAAGKPLSLAWRGARGVIDRGLHDKDLLEKEGHKDAGSAAGLPVEELRALLPDDAVYGLGDKPTVLNKRSYAYENWNSDIPDPHEECFKSLYKDFPVFFVSSAAAERTYGIFFDNTFHTYFDFGFESPDYLSFGAKEGALNYYFFAGPTLREAVSRYTWLTGRAPLPQRWALGYQQCRWGYASAEAFRALARKFRELDIPLDALHFDIDYMDGYRVFTTNDKTFPDFPGLLAELKAQGIKAVTIIDPGVKVDPKYYVYQEGLQKGYFCKDKNDLVYVNEVWPGDSVFPDFGAPEVRGWWAGLQRFLTDRGVSGVWNDMNEPASFRGPLPDDVQMHDEERLTTHAEMHNCFGHNMAKASYEGWKAATGERPFVITRACYSGSQKYAVVWTGDNQSLWGHLRMSIPQQCSLGLSGMAFHGTDIGGFGADCTPELMARWIQAGCFSPLFRSHSSMGTRVQEPWRFGDEVTAIFRKYVKLRYRLQPYFYDLFRECEETGLPPMRALVLNYEDDPNVHELNDEFMLGDQMLVAPVVEQGARQRMIYLPKGDWYDFWTGEKQEGGRYFVREAPLDLCPIYVKAGTILPLYPEQRYTDELADPELTLRCYPGEGVYEHYRDNGRDFTYRDGAYTLYRFTLSNAHLTTTLLHDNYKPYTKINVEYV